MKKTFYGWWITLAAFCTFGISVGIPYYNMPFFYDYFEKTFGWSRADVTLGFPLAALLTLWVGPVLVHRFSPRKLIITGTGLLFLAFVGFGRMSGSLWVYFAVWFIWVVGYIFAGPIPHQVIVSQWFRRLRGRAMAVTYVGVAVGGSLGSYLVKPLTEGFGFQTALQIMGLVLFLAWPIAIWAMKDRPSDMGLHPDGAAASAPETAQRPRDFGDLLRRPAFWLLAAGSCCSIAAIGAVNQHMKLVFLDQGFTDQAALNSVWRVASMLTLWSSIAGRLVMGWLADRFSKKYVMASTYLLVSLTIPLLLLVRPGHTGYLYVFAVLFGFGMGADYMLIPLMAAEQFGVNTLARAMAIILPTDTIGQTWFPYLVSRLRLHFGDYGHALTAVFLVAFLGFLAIAWLPKQGTRDAAL
ncbi:MAG: MFS transporter [Bryobacteraceae bacterium]